MEELLLAAMVSMVKRPVEVAVVVGVVLRFSLTGAAAARPRVKAAAA